MCGNRWSRVGWAASPAVLSSGTHRIGSWIGFVHQLVHHVRAAEEPPLAVPGDSRSADIGVQRALEAWMARHQQFWLTAVTPALCHPPHGQSCECVVRFGYLFLRRATPARLPHSKQTRSGSSGPPSSLQFWPALRSPTTVWVVELATQLYEGGSAFPVHAVRESGTEDHDRDDVSLSGKRDRSWLTAPLPAPAGMMQTAGAQL